MKYSHIFSAVLPAMALAAMFSACTFEQEDFFEESASLRIQHTNEDIQAKLVAASGSDQYGWLIQYWVAGTDDYDFEGFNLFGRFTSTGAATLASNHRYLRNGNAGKYTEYTSCYEMLNEEGCVLSFNTWNDILSPFVDPVSPGSAPTSLINDGEGMNGDDRLVMLSYSDDEMLFRGERHSAKARFVKLDRPAKQYIADVAYMKSRVANENVTEYAVKSSDKTLYISGLNKGYFSLCDRLDDPLASETKNCVFTPTGFRLQNPVAIGSDSCQEFTVNADTTALVSGNVQVIPCWVRYIGKACNTSNYVTITTDGACSSLATMLTTLADGIKANFSSQTFTGLSFGKSSEAGSNCRNGLSFICTTKTKKNITAFTGSVSVDSETNTATISVDVNDPSSNFTNYSKKGIATYFTDIVNAINGTYNITCDNVFHPTRVTFTKQNDSSFYFVMQM